MKNSHGGNITYFKELLGTDTKILDFSSNINPLGLPEKINCVLNNITQYINTYPDIQYKALRKALEDYTTIDYNNIIVGNGATELIHHSINSLKPKKALNIKPAYSEYEVELKKINCHIIDYYLKEKNNFNIDKDIFDYLEKVDTIIICNPNNPTGSLYEKEDLQILLERCKYHNVSVIVDETYSEFSRKQSALSLVKDFDNLYVIRGTSKFFALSGLRLGYLMTSNIEVLENIRKNILPWTVNTIAEAVGQVVFTDKVFIEKSLENTESEILYFKNIIDEIQCLKFFNTNSNLLLVKILDDKKATSFTKYCLDHNVIIRDLTHYGFKENGDKFFRISPLNRIDNEVLGKLITEFFNN